MARQPRPELKRYIADIGERVYQETFVQILPVRGEARVITVMEVLSPSNRAREQGEPPFVRNPITGAAPQAAGRASWAAPTRTTSR